MVVILKVNSWRWPKTLVLSSVEVVQFNSEDTCSQAAMLITQQLCAPVFLVTTNKISGFCDAYFLYFNFLCLKRKHRGQETQPVYAGLDQLAIYYTYILEFYVRNRELILVLTPVCLYMQVKQKNQHMCQLLCMEGHCSVPSYLAGSSWEYCLFPCSWSCW